MTLAASVKRNYFPTILILLHIVIFLYKISIGQFFLIDSYEYYQLAKNILNQGVFYHEDLKALPLIPEAYTRRPPLYSLFIIFSSLFFTSDIAILIFQNICSVLSILGIKKIFENEGYFVSKNLFLIVLITSLNQFIYTNLIMSEILFQFLIVLIIFFAQKALKNRSLHHFIATQLVLVLLFLTKPVFYLFLIPNLFLSFLFLKKTKLKKIYLFYSFIPIIVLFFYCFWNFQRTENFEMSSLQNHNLIDWNLKSFHVHAYGSSVADSINHEIQTTASSIISYPVKQEFYKTQVINYIKKDWFAYSLFHLIGSVRCFVDPGRFDLYSFFDIETNMSFMNIMNRGDIRLLWKPITSNSCSYLINYDYHVYF